MLFRIYLRFAISRKVINSRVRRTSHRIISTLVKVFLLSWHIRLIILGNDVERTRFQRVNRTEIFPPYLSQRRTEATIIDFRIVSNGARNRIIDATIGRASVSTNIEGFFLCLHIRGSSRHNHSVSIFTRTSTFLVNGGFLDATDILQILPSITIIARFLP